MDLYELHVNMSKTRIRRKEMYYIKLKSFNGQDVMVGEKRTNFHGTVETARSIYNNMINCTLYILGVKQEKFI